MNILNVIMRVLFVLSGMAINLIMAQFLYEISGFNVWVPAIYLGLWALFVMAMLTHIGDKWLDLSIGTRVPTRDEAGYLEIAENLLRESAEYYGEKFPKKLRLRVITDIYPNAMAFGSQTVGLTSGLLETAEPKEVAGVFAHEVGHIVNRDTLFNVLVYAAFGPLLWVGVLGGNFMLSFIRNDFFFGIIASAFLLMIFGIPLIAVIVHWLFNFFLSFTNRTVEYAADAYAIRVTRDEGLLTFLQKIKHLDAGPSGRFLAAYQASHPPTALREDKARIILESLEDNT